MPSTRQLCNKLTELTFISGLVFTIVPILKFVLINDYSSNTYLFVECHWL